MDRSQPSLPSSYGSALGLKSYSDSSSTNDGVSIVYAPARSRVFPVQLESPQAKFLILRSHAKRGVSKDGNEHHVFCRPFETPTEFTPRVLEGAAPQCE